MFKEWSQKKAKENAIGGIYRFIEEQLAHGRGFNVKFFRTSETFWKEMTEKNMHF